MARTIETTVFQFDELSDRAKEKARDWFRRGSDEDNSFAESVIEDAARIADMIGIDLRTRAVRLMGGGTRMEPCIYWSGFSHQGSGACFVGTYRYAAGSVKKVATEAPAEYDGQIQKDNAEVNRITRELADLQKAHFYKLSADVSHFGHGEHEHSVRIEVDCDCKRCKHSGVPQDEISELLRDFMRWIYRRLEAEYDYQNADAQVDENIRANEYEFDEDGNRA